MMDTIGQRIKRIRLYTSLPMSEFANTLNVTTDYIIGLESNKSPLFKNIKEIICNTFNIRKEWLDEGEGIPVDLTKYNLDGEYKNMIDLSLDLDVNDYIEYKDEILNNFPTELHEEVNSLGKLAYGV